MSSVRERIDAVLEWSDTDKGMIPVFFLILTNTQYLLWGAYARGRPDADELVHLAVLEDLQSQVFYITLGAALLLGVGALIRRRYPDLWVYQLITALYFGLTLVACSQYVGTLEISAGVVLVGAPLFGFIVLNRFVVWVAFLCSLLALISLSYLSAAGAIPYAPMVRHPMTGAGPVFWTVSSWSFAAPHIVLIVVVADRVLGWWRKREQTIERMSRTDALTGIRNRRSVLEVLAHEWARSARHGNALSVALLDLDHFKQINDSWGHPAGDEVLIATATLLQDSVRECDAVGRYGGEEFMLVLPDTPAEGAQALVERCRAGLRALDLRAPGGEPIPVSGSFGLVCVSQAADTDVSVGVEQVIKAADDALYRAKEAGRDRVVVASLG